MVSDPLANPILGLLDGTCGDFQIGGQRRANLEGNERIDDLVGHGIHESPTSLGLPLDVVSNLRPSGSKRCGLKTSIKELIHVGGLAVKLDERFITEEEISGEQKGGGDWIN